ncbi:hypothetical protein P3T22_006467 [Paraburkholderia sp. GAS348]
MFDLLEGTAGLPGDLSETNPYQYGAGDLIALDARFAALAALDPGQFFGLAMKLLDLPAQAARVLCGLRRILSEVVGDDPVRAACRHLNPEQVHVVMFATPGERGGRANSDNRITVDKYRVLFYFFRDCARSGKHGEPVGPALAEPDISDGCSTKPQGR